MGYECSLCGRMFKTGGGYSSHMRSHQSNLDIGKDFDIGKDGDIIKSSGGSLGKLLERLLVEGIVAVEVDGPRIFKKSRIGKHVLFIAMGSTFGDPRGIMFALAGGGCEVIRLNDLRVSPLIRVGLQADMAREIICQLRKLVS